MTSLYLKPGGVTVIVRPALVSTVLGSCVAATMYCPQTRIGGICHAVLPSGGAGSGLQYVDNALQYMFDQFSQHGIQKRRLQIKLFGGADMFQTLRSEEGFLTVGRQNIAAALEVLERHGLDLAAQDVGGIRGRKLLFNTQSGEVLLKRLPGRPPASVGREERPRRLPTGTAS